MAIRKIKFRMTAKIIQDHIVEIDENDVPEGQDVVDYAMEIANQTWDCTQSKDEEKFDQQAEYMDDVE